jgi:hypothetical protein
VLFFAAFFVFFRVISWIRFFGECRQCYELFL